jgi:hypothetical protein
MIVHSVSRVQKLFLVSSFLLLLLGCNVLPDPTTDISLEATALRASFTRQFGTANKDETTALATDPSGNVYMAVNTSIGPGSEGRDTASVLVYDPSGNLLRTLIPSSCCGFWYTYVSGVVTDSSGNVYIAGHFTDYFQTYYVYLEKYDSGGNLLWTKQFRERTTSSLGDPTTMRAHGLSVDGLGNLYLLFQKSFHPYQTPVVYVRKYNAAGGLRWEKLVSNTSPSAPATLTTDADGNVYTAVICVSNTTQVDTCLSKLDTGGNSLWSVTLPSSVYQYVSGLTTDADGNLFMTGYTQGSLEGTNQGFYDAFVRKYDGSSNVLWTKQFGTTGVDFANAITTDPSGNVFVVGSTQGSLPPNFTNKGSYDAYLRQYDTNGNALRTRQLGTPLSDIGSRVTTDTSGNIFLGGSTERSFQAGIRNKGGLDAYVRKYTP